MSALLSTLPPPPSRPGLSRSLPRSDSYDRATPRELKAEAIRLFPHCGLGKRELARKLERSKSAVQYWLDPKALDRTPPVSFVRFLKLHVEMTQLQASIAEVIAR
jgi:hypothetical protein